MFNLLARKTNVPSVLMLMLTGIGINIFAEVQPQSLMKILEILGTVGLIMIVLEAALDLKLTKDKWPLLWRSMVLALLLLFATTALIAAIFYYGLEMPMYSSILYAVPLSVMSSAIVIPSVGGLSEHKKEFMIFEASFSDIFGIMLFYFLADLKEADSVGLVFKEVSLNIIGTIVISLLLSFGLIVIFQKIRSKIKLFLLVSSLLLLYSFGKMMHMSSLVTILIFGLLLNNRELFFRGKLADFVQPIEFDQILENFRMITMESAFVVRTFFFVIFGMSVVLTDLYNPVVFIVSAVILAATYIVRYLGFRGVVGKNINPEVFISPRGLITVLLFYAIPEDLQVPDFHTGILLMIIIASSVIMTIALINYGKQIGRDDFVLEGREEEGLHEGGGEFEPVVQATALPEHDRQEPN